MFLNNNSIYVCPGTLEKLTLKENDSNSSTIASNYYVSCNNPELVYTINKNIPNFTYPATLGKEDKHSLQEYEAAAKDYDDLQKVTFSILKQNEYLFRFDMAKRLRLKKDSFVLETAAGTGLNVPFIHEVVGSRCDLFLQDLSYEMLEISKKYDSIYDDLNIHRSVGNASYLPFPSNQFDAVLSFGGIGVFSEKKRAIEEMFRVVKPGGRIVFGDEGVAPWLRETNYGKKLTYNNHYYADVPPVDFLPVEARDVNLQWVLGGAFYLIDLTVGEGEPDADFDFPIPGYRGGTINTRFFGQLEGVSEHTKKVAWQACRQNNMSMHQWLDAIVKEAAEETFKGQV